jgi:hypothetical protein
MCETSITEGVRGALKHLQLSILALPAILLIFIFSYIPMGGIFIAFKNINFVDGIFHSPWVGFDNFKFFFTSDDAWLVVRNTLLYNIVFIVVGTCIAVLFAVLLNEVLSVKLIKFYQTVFFFPGVLAQAGIDAYAPTTTKQVDLYQNANLANGSHTIKVVCDGTKNASSYDTTCAVDAFATISAPDQTAYYKLVNKNSGKVMDVSGGSFNSGANIIQSSDTNASSQHWQVIDLGNGYFKILNTNSGCVLDVRGGSTTAGAQLIQSTDTGANSQQWRLVKTN